jgi:hypothetical protein
MRPLLLAIVLTGCRTPTDEKRTAMDVPAVAPAPDTDVVVATVDGRPIRASDVALQAGAKGVTAKQALDDLVDAEVLAGEARKKAVKPDADAMAEVRDAMVRALLKGTFERETTPDTVPQRSVERFYQRKKGDYDHDVLVHVLHILTPTRGLSDEKKAEAKKTAEALAVRARAVKSADEFRALATKEQKLEDITTERVGWTERAFSEGAFTQLKKPGDVSGVIATSYGYHVLYLVEYQPAQHKSLAETAPSIRALLFPAWRTQHFLDWTAELQRRHQVVVHAEKLGAPKK